MLSQFVVSFAMAKKASSAGALQALFSVDNPFRRKPQLSPPLTTPPPALALQSKPVEIGLGLGLEAALPEVDRKRKKENEPDVVVSLKRKKNPESGDVGVVEESPRKRRRKRKRDEIEEKYGRRKLGEGLEVVEEKDGAGDGGKVVAVGEKRKASDLVKDMVVPKEEEEFDDEEKLLRTVFVGNLPLRTKKKALMKEFGRFGEIESVRIRSVPLLDVSSCIIFIE